MKTLLNISLLLLVLLFVSYVGVFAQQQTNQDAGSLDTWSPDEYYSPKLDISRTKFSRNSSGRGTFSSYGETGWYSGNWAIQVGYFRPINNLLTPDTIVLNCEFKGGINNTLGICVYLAIFDSTGAGYFWGTDNRIPSNSSSLRRFSWNMTKAKNAGSNGWIGIKNISKIGLYFASYATDSVYTGVTVEVSDLMFKDSTGKSNLIDFGLLSTGVNGIKEISGQNPSRFTLEQNYPNPFNPSTKISFSIPGQEHVTLKVYNMLGTEVSTLVDKTMSAGNHEVSFDASKLSNGTYFYRLQTGGSVETKKMVLLK
jgi:hypothetical protein